MIPTYTEPYRDGELRIGWASWDNGTFKDRSIKYAYRDASGKISRGSPELPFDILIDMMMLAGAQGELRAQLRAPAVAFDLTKASVDELRDEKRRVSIALMMLVQFGMEFPWADWNGVYNELGKRVEEVKSELGKRGIS
ncbi:hypothetical protein V5F32_13480 [Xanthobacter oligotrophicus]|uniref:Tail assembly chaperone n=1 Tax=Xanthobacter oligotrophicus TaxID=2607286 RepID=A0ABW6ZWR7_9HYPH